MNTENLKSKIEMKGMLESEIKEQMEKIAEMAKDILIDNDEIFNSSSLKPTIFKGSITFQLNCKVDYSILKKLDKVLNPSKIILEGWGSSNFMTSTPRTGFVNLSLVYGKDPELLEE